MMSSSYLEADVSVLASTIRARLQRHRSHRFKVCVYKWWDAALGECHAFALAQLSQGRSLRSIAISYFFRFSAIAGGPGRKSPDDGTVSFEDGVEVIVTRVGR
jgi:hypothetical protein